MMGYELEKKQLSEWLLSECDRIDREVKIGPGLDGENSKQHRLLTAEYNRRLRELKAKYGKE